ncbi:hypothetical protein [Vibrio atypicus]|uniref:hypothetical protein n=1 Tax=Vibrio atypicus TaxID=558271 RepID=UPI00135A7D2A|nr:hypothetical protein [Vibrio atypicus]
MKKRLATLHRTAACSAFLMIFTFFSSSLLVELFGSEQDIFFVKTAISYAVWVLVPLMAVTGITGAKMAPNPRKGPLVNKKKRMPIVAANGLLILLPAAFYLQHLAALGQFDMIFYAVQGIELVAGFINLTLMGLSIRDARSLKRSSVRKAA